MGVAGWIQSQLLERIKELGIESGSIELVYEVKTETAIENANLWAQALKRQCEIWLFAAQIQIVEMKESNG